MWSNAQYTNEIQVLSDLFIFILHGPIEPDITRSIPMIR